MKNDIKILEKEIALLSQISERETDEAVIIMQMMNMD